ncbi:signal recognition particle receptor subunit alpha-like [Schistocerca gregaria]|uniref:signal recognition particle receptor subunit alpha-like n=1 Tax=Schistocerca gregaria TaxID=7010 RepID=UPI00211DEA9A|nr:signal recognition particle receptor subunit alpha-like [Schistocerca gregaria]
MLENFLIFSKGGVVIYECAFAVVEGNPVNELIDRVLIEGQLDQDSYSNSRYVLYWKLLNEYDLILVAVCLKLLQKSIHYAKELLEEVASEVLALYGERLRKEALETGLRSGVGGALEGYDLKFRETLEVVRKRANERRCAQKVITAFWDTPKGQEIIKNRDQGEKKGKVGKGKKEPKGAEKKRGGVTSRSKKSRNWNGEEASIEELSRCDLKDVVEDELLEERKAEERQVHADAIEADLKASDTESDEGEEQQAGESLVQTEKRGLLGGIFGYVKNLTQKELTPELLAPTLEQIRMHLISKNIAPEVARRLCKSVEQSLVGEVHGSFNSLKKTVRGAMCEVLTRILTSKKEVNIPRQVEEARRERRPFSIVFVGVNGVGKSTSLAKVCRWMLRLKYKVMIAACDTFRSGAIEQLRTHSKALDVPLYAQGYGKNAGSIALQAILKAKEEGIDVVLIDTAGRMQDNAPLMSALTNLVEVSNPDLILFVGETSVGNDSLDQLTKFDRVLKGNEKNPRSIDGIILTKFDIVDDKVGTAISIVYSSEIPIVLVGTGQNYEDIRALNVKQAVGFLMDGK